MNRHGSATDELFGIVEPGMSKCRPSWARKHPHQRYLRCSHAPACPGMPERPLTSKSSDEKPPRR